MIQRSRFTQTFSTVGTFIVPTLENLISKPCLSLAFTYKTEFLVDVVHARS